MPLLKELRRRNVVRVAILYVVMAWIVVQVTDVLSSLLNLPDWTGPLVLVLLALGLVPALIFSWVYELTPEGLKRESEIDRSASIAAQTGRKLDVMIVILLGVAIASIWADRILFEQPVLSDSSMEQEITDSKVAENSIAVLPFVNMSSDAENEYFSDGLSEELLNLLTRIPQLRVAARTSSFSFKDSNETVAAIAEALNVAYILEGSVRKSGDVIRITTQLIAAESGFQLWSETYEHEVEDIFETQEEIAASVTDALKVTLLGDIPSPQRANAEAYELYLQCQYLSHRSDLDSYARAIAACKRALEIDDGYAPAWSELATSQWWYTGFGGMEIETGVARATESVERALELDPDNARAYFIRGMLQTASNFEFAKGYADFARAAELEPGNAQYVFGTAAVHFQSGQLNRALEQVENAIELDPLSPSLYRFLGVFYRALGRDEEAAAAIEKSLALNPSTVAAHYTLGRTYLDQGLIDEARREFEVEPSVVYRLTGLSMAHHVSGDSDASNAALERLIEVGSEIAAWQIAEVYAARGDIDKCFEWLERARMNRDSGVANILPYAKEFELLHSDPRWSNFLQQLGLLETWLALPPEWGGPGLSTEV
jgi:adenylate cyclase